MMKKCLTLLCGTLLLFPAASAAPDVHGFVDFFKNAGAQAGQYAKENFPDPFIEIRKELNDMKEAYKEEGRAYARELGDTMMERAMANKKVDQTLNSVRVLCWGVVAYITVVSLLLFGMMLHIHALLRKLQPQD